MILCADDFGMATGISEAISDLVEAGRITAVACIVPLDAAKYPAAASLAKDFARLRRLRARADVGLHLVVPKSNAPGYLDIPTLLAPRFWRAGARAELRRSFLKQCRVFEELLGSPPDFIDGHRHIQQLPTVRAAYLDVLGETSRTHAAYAKCAVLPGWAIRRNFRASLKLGVASLAISALGHSLANSCRARALPANRYLLGYLDYRSFESFADLLSTGSIRTGENDILYCHPGKGDIQLAEVDSLVEERLPIYNFLMSRAFASALENDRVSLNRFSFRPK